MTFIFNKKNTSHFNKKKYYILYFAKILPGYIFVYAGTLVLGCIVCMDLVNGLLFAGSSEEPPHVCCSGGGGDSQRTDKRTVGEESSARV